MPTIAAKPHTKPLIAKDALDLICNTPLVKINKLVKPGMAAAYG